MKTFLAFSVHFTQKWSIPFRQPRTANVGGRRLACVSTVQLVGAWLSSGSRSELQTFTGSVEARPEWDLFSVSVYTSWKSCVYSAANSSGPSGTEGSAVRRMCAAPVTTQSGDGSKYIAIFAGAVIVSAQQ